MGSFTDYRGLSVRTPDPVGDAGLVLNTNFKELADRSGPVYSTAANPDANDDSADTNGNGKFYLWSKWLNTGTNSVFICIDATPTAAVWRTLSTVALGGGGTILIDGVQVLYLPDQTDFTGTIVFGDGGTNLSTAAPPDGRYNTVVGLEAFDANTEGDSNNVLGFAALEDNTTGSRNVAIGYYALRKNIDGDYNIAVGDEALLTNTTGDGNVCVGNKAGEDITGSYNICIGYMAGEGQGAISNKLFIDITDTATPLIYGEFDSRILKIHGNLYIPTDTNKLYFGVAANDYNIMWDGNDAVHTITAGQFLFTGGELIVKDKIIFTQLDGNEYIDSLNDGYLDIGATTGIRLQAETLATTKVIFTQVDGNEYIDSLNDGYMDYGATSGHRFLAPIYLTNDDRKIFFGIDSFASICYNGTDLLINPIEGGGGLANITGNLKIDGTTLALDKIKFTQTDGNEYVDSNNDNYLDLGATTQIRLNADILANGKISLKQVDGNEYIDGSNDNYVDIGATTAIRLKAATLAEDKLYFTQTDGDEYIDSLNDGYLDLGATTDVRCQTSFLALDKIKLTQTDGVEYIDSLADGYVDIGAGTSIRLNAVVLATDKIKFTQIDGNEYIDSVADNYLDLGATTQIRLNAPTLADGKISLKQVDGNEYIDGSNDNYVDIGATTAIRMNNDLHILGDATLISFGVPSDNDYTIQWNGSDAVHTITAGDFVFTGGNMGIGMADPAFKLEINGKFGIDDIQIIYLPDQTDFIGSMILGDGGNSLSHTASEEGRYNLGIGVGTLEDITTGRGNMCMGYEAGKNITVGRENIAIGKSALPAVTNADWNTAIGTQALNSNTGNYNVGIGYIALFQNSTGINNVAIGNNTGKNKQTGNDNVFIGNAAGIGSGLYNTEKNTIIGRAAGALMATGALNNILIGYQAGNVITTGHDNIIIGHDIDPSANDANNELNIGDIIKGDISANEIYYTGEIWQHSPTSGGGLRQMMAEAVGTAGAAPAFTIEVNVPTGARINAVQLRVDTSLTSGDGGVSWEAEVSGGVSQPLGGGYAFNKDTQASAIFDSSGATLIANAEVDILVTCDSAKNFQAGGQVRAIVYYQDLVPMDATQ